MTLKETLDVIRVRVLPGLGGKGQLDNDKLTVLINEGIRTLHFMFNIRTEQAIIFVPAFRNTFKLNNTDPNVIMASYSKLAECAVKGIYKSKAEMLKDILDLNKGIKEDILLNNETENKDIFSTKHDKLMRILSISDDEKKEYILNEKLVYALDQETLYFPECKETDLIYVQYKPKPLISSTAVMDKEIDLPDTLLDVLFAYIPLKIITGVDGYTQLYPNLINQYNEKLLEAKAMGAVVSDSMEAKYVAWKGFV